MNAPESTPPQSTRLASTAARSAPAECTPAESALAPPPAAELIAPRAAGLTRTDASEAPPIPTPATAGSASPRASADGTRPALSPGAGPVVVVIPARHASTRYPGKPLVELRGAGGRARSLIRRSWDAAQAVAGVDRVIVATDDARIADHAAAFGAEVAMTSTACRNGTERCAEVLAQLPVRPAIVVNLQGDAPLTPAWFVEDLVAALSVDPAAEVATPVLNCTGAMRADLMADRAAGRVGGTTAVFGADGQALYFSKEVIPYVGHDIPPEAPSPVFHHVGVYAYRPDALAAYPAWPEGALERLEGLEQLRFLERGRRILCVEVEARGRQFWELNNPSDVERLESMMRRMGMD